MKHSCNDRTMRDIEWKPKKSSTKSDGSCPNTTKQISDGIHITLIIPIMLKLPPRIKGNKTTKQRQFPRGPHVMFLQWFNCDRHQAKLTTNSTKSDNSCPKIGKPVTMFILIWLSQIWQNFLRKSKETNWRNNKNSHMGLTLWYCDDRTVGDIKWNQ